MTVYEAFLKILQSQTLRMFFMSGMIEAWGRGFNEFKAVRQIGTHCTQNAFAVGIFFKGDMYENFHNCRKNKAAYAYKKNGHYFERAEQNAAYYRSQQSCKGTYHIYHCVALHKKLFSVISGMLA